MESPEDDAGIATSASRRESAREKDVGQTEEVDATGSYDQDSPEARTSCQTPAMSEDNFDGDSVPSPSTQDVNTSTEAILDMIDEIVDGPGAPKRLPLVCESVYLQYDLSSTTSNSPLQELTKNIGESSTPSPQIAVCVSSDSSKDEVQPECLSFTEASEIVNVSSENSNHASVSVSECTKTVHILQSVPHCASVSSVEPGTSTTHPNIHSSSALQTVQNISESSDCEKYERTVQCVASSETRDCVTVEKAESTSSDCSVSEGQALIMEKSTKSPLRRRLIRPLPNDRRPDSTVSSTVDSQSVNICTTVQITENITKDVSSSSDAIPAVHGNIKSDDIRNVSATSVCKAETSVSSPKKIKLIRPKFIIPEESNDSIIDNQVLTSDQQFCQSTSTDILSTCVTNPSTESSSNVISTSDHFVNQVKSIIIPEFSEQYLTGQVSEDTIMNEEAVNINLSIPNTPSLLDQTNDNCNSDVKQESNLSKLTSESLIVSETSNTKQVISDQCTKDEIKETLSKLTDSNLNTNDSNLNVDNTDKKDVLLPNVELKDEQIKIDPCISSSTLVTYDKSIVVDDKRVELLENRNETFIEDGKKLSPLKLNLSGLLEPSTSALVTNEEDSKNEYDTIKQVPKLTIKLSNTQAEELKSPTPKVTIKPLKPPTDDERSIKIENCQQIPCVAKLNIKPILKPPDNHDEFPTKLHTAIDNTNAVVEQMPCVFKLNIKPIQKPQENLSEISTKSHKQDEGNSKSNIIDHIPSIKKLNIKPILKPPEKINDIHRKSSSSEISESEYSENDETTSTSDQASVSDQGTTDVVPKVTIKLGKPGTESEGKFYTEQNIPKLTIKGLQSTESEDLESTSKLKLVISQQDNKQLDKIPKLTIKTLTKSESQPLSPKLTIKPLRPPESIFKEIDVSKTRLCAETVSTCSDIKENIHVPKITIKSITKSDVDSGSKTPKKSTVTTDNADNIPFVTKLNIKPILKPMDNEETSGEIDDKVPVVSKLNIKPVIRPKDNEIDFSLEDVPKITKLNIKPIKCPEVNSSEQKDCDGLKTDIDKSSIPVITKINIKPIVKPEEEGSKYSENQSSETSNSSDDNADHIPVITKLNIKPISKPTDESLRQNLSHEQTIPNITKLNIKPLIKPDDISSPSSPKKEHSKNIDLRSSCIPVVTKLNIKPIVKPEGAELKKSNDEFEEKLVKNPPLVMKINIKSVGETLNKDNSPQDHKHNNLDEYTHGNHHSKTDKASEYAELPNTAAQSDCQDTITFSIYDSNIKQNCISGESEHHNTAESVAAVQIETSMTEENRTNSLLSNKSVPENLRKTDISQTYEKNDDNGQVKKDVNIIKAQNPDLIEIQSTNKPKVALQNCTLLKKLLENTKDHLSKKVEESRMSMSNCLLNQETMKLNKDINCTKLFDSREPSDLSVKNTNLEKVREGEDIKLSNTDVLNDTCNVTKSHTIHNICEVANSDSLTKPLEINISEKLSNQSSGLDSPRIILKINKTDHGPSAKIITEEIKRPGTPQQIYSENTQENLNDSESLKKHNVNSRRKLNSEDSLSMSVGKRLRSSRIVENIEKSPHVRRNMGKRSSTTETSPSQNKETELSILETKRLKLGQLLSVNKSLTLTPVVTRITQTSPTKTSIEHKQGGKSINHSLLNNENCSKNGNSKLHNILSNLQAKQKQSLPFQDINHVEVASITTENRTHSPLNDTEMIPKENCHTKVQEMLINENSDFRDLGTIPDDTSKDPLEVDTPKEVSIVLNESIVVPQHVEMTPQPKKRGRPRKIPLTDSPKPVAIVLPVPALEERPQRSLRLTRDRPTILRKPRGRGRGRGARKAVSPSVKSLLDLSSSLTECDDRTTPIDPTCSRIKLPRMTEALDNMPGGCSTPLSSRRRSSSNSFLDRELKDEANSSKLEDVFLKSPEIVVIRGRGGRGSRGGRGRTPRGRGRGRGRGGGRGAVYMKETMGIYGRVCGPATTTVQLFEEETCMMDDNATPAKPSHLMDEDSQGSVKSSTNESNKVKKSKFADLFDSNKIWTAADVKEYTWPTQEKPDAVPQIMMIQEQVAMFLGVKSFKRRYPELKRRPIVGEEKDYVLAKGLVTEALCDLGITAVDASEVLDIMLSDYPHKYEEYRSHQRERQLTEPVEEPKVEIKTEEKPLRVEIKVEKYVEPKPDVPKIDPEKVRQDTAAAAIASASEWNARVNALRRTACVDLQTMTVHRRRAPMPAPRTHMQPPAGFYPHALLPGQYQHAYRVYTPEQLRYFPLNTVLAAPVAPPSPADSSSDSEPEWGSRSSSSEDSESHIHPSKRKKLSKVKRSSQTDNKEKEENSMDTSGEETCRTCKLRLEGNRKYTHERFLVCANCNAKLHPSCVELSADTIRKCREYAWQCAECKTCCTCRLPADDDKMLFCDLCDRGFHIYCVGLGTVPTGRWHCVECAICKSCGARDPAGLGATSASTSGTTPGIPTGGAEWHHQTRRGPGGHKVYSHSLCTPCARAYRIGRYCPLCERSFIGPKGTMQLVICKLCDRQLHQECVRQTVSRLKVLDYTCADCRRGGITSRAAAVRLAPRTIATLFMAKRRFNKYAHRQYMRNRTATADPTDATDPPDPTDPADQSLDCAG